MDVSRLREQIPVCQDRTYMNTGWSGPSPVPVVNAIKQWLDYEMLQGPTSPEVYQSGREVQSKVRTAVARLVNATDSEICITRNTTEGLNIVINGLRWKQGDEIITCALEHSSVLIPSYFQQHRHGAVVRVLDLTPDETQETILEKIEAIISERTKLVFLSHVQYSCGLRMPLKEIRRMAKDRGALLLVDGAQAAGQIPLDMSDLDCDFYSIPGQKWLLGPDGLGALYVRNDMIPRVDPTHVASRAVVSADDPYRFEPDPNTIDKFLITSTSVALQAGWLEAIGFIQDIGVEQIERRNIDLATALKDALAETPNVKVLSPMERQSSSGLVSFAIDGISPEEAVSRLWEKHRIVARHVVFPPGVRVSLHFFNTEKEVQEVIDAVRGMP